MRHEQKHVLRCPSAHEQRAQELSTTEVEGARTKLAQGIVERLGSAVTHVQALERHGRAFNGELHRPASLDAECRTERLVARDERTERPLEPRNVEFAGQAPSVSNVVRSERGGRLLNQPEHFLRW
jgi:hypothetical protein